MQFPESEKKCTPIIILSTVIKDIVSKFSNLYLYFVLLTGILLRITDLTESLWFDEISYSTSWHMKSASDLLHIIFAAPEAPVYRIFIFFWIRIFGESEISVRFPSLILGILTLLLIYKVILFLRDKKIAALTSLMICFSPVHIWYSKEATPYSMVLFFLFLSILFKKYNSRHRPIYGPVSIFQH